MSSASIAVTVYGTTDIGKEREHNEDALSLWDLHMGEVGRNGRPYVADTSTRPFAMAISDGMGGENAGEIASALTLESFRRALINAIAAREPDEALRTAIEQANDEVTIAGGIPGQTHMGATLVAVLLDGPYAYVASVGDSRAYLLRRGLLTQLTRDQSLVQLLVERGAVSPTEARAFPHRNVILQAIGRATSLDLTIGRLSLRKDDRLLLCSDGLSSEMDDDEIRVVLASDAPVDHICGRLIGAANGYGGHDNITVIVASMSGPALPDPSPGESVTQTLSAIEPRRRRTQSG